MAYFQEKLPNILNKFFTSFGMCVSDNCSNMLQVVMCSTAQTDDADSVSGFVNSMSLFLL